MRLTQCEAILVQSLSLTIIHIGIDALCNIDMLYCGNSINCRYTVDRDR